MAISDAAVGCETIYWYDATKHKPETGEWVLVAVAWEPVDAEVFLSLWEYAVWPAIWAEESGWRVLRPVGGMELDTDERVAYWCAMPSVAVFKQEANGDY